MYETLADHDADPPTVWQVEKAAERCWHLNSSRGGTIGSYPTKKAAEADKVSGPHVALWEKEGRWMRGETVPGWRPYAEVERDRDRRKARLEARYRRHAIKFTLDCAGDPTDEALKRILDHCVRPPHAREYPAIRRHVEEYRARKARYTAAFAHLAATLAHFRHYPPEENSTDGTCCACGFAVAAHQGMFAMGSDEKGLFGAYLHRGCLAGVRRVRKLAGDRDAKVRAARS
jgi:hypothetical protein